jgi:hypothetical protein
MIYYVVIIDEVLPFPIVHMCVVIVHTCTVHKSKVVHGSRTEYISLINVYIPTYM